MAMSTFVQHLPNNLNKGGSAYGLEEISSDADCLGLFFRNDCTVATTEYNWHCGLYFKNFLGQFKSRKVGHTLVGDNQIKLVRLIANQFQGFPAVGYSGYFIA